MDVARFNVFYLREMGLTLADIGKANTFVLQTALSTGLAGFAAMYFAAVFVDRWHPIRIQFYWSTFLVAACVSGFSSWVWIFVSLPPGHFFWLNVVGTGVLVSFFMVLGNASSLPAVMRLFPKSRFGQFCSAQAILRSFVQFVCGLLVGLFFDQMSGLFRDSGGANFGYRFIFVANAVFTLFMAGFAMRVYMEWRKLGGDDHYASPAYWAPGGREKVDCFPFAGPLAKWLRVALSVIHVTMALSTLGTVILLVWMLQHGARTAYHWHLVLLLPASLAVWGVWFWLERSLRAELKRCLEAGRPLDALPHHGVLNIVGFTYLALLGVWVANVVSAIRLQMETAAVLFTAASIIGNLLVIGGVAFVWRVERRLALALGGKSAPGSSNGRTA